MLRRAERAGIRNEKAVRLLKGERTAQVIEKVFCKEELHKRRDSVKKWMEPASSRLHPYENP